MASLKEMTAAFSTAVGHRRYLLPSLALATGAVLEVLMLRYGILIDPDGPFAYLPLMGGLLVALGLILWWLLDYAACSRSELKGIVNIEEALDSLSTYFDEGTQIFDTPIKDEPKFRYWDARRTAWQEKVQKYLQENFGLRERNMFRNVLIIQQPTIQGSFNDEHNHHRALLAQQLEKIRDAIIRYSDLAAKRRAESA
jgi:hypothetical protein